MKIQSRDADRFLAKPPATLCAILIYGENAGLAREFAEAITEAIVPGAKDADRIVDIPADQLRRDPARLADEAAQISMFSPGRRVLRIKDASEGMGELFARFLDAHAGDAMLVVEAGELSARASLRVVFETATNAAAIACYDDNVETLSALAQDIMRGHSIEAAPEIAQTLVNRLGLDRRMVRAELAKLALYFGGDGTSAPRRLTGELLDELFGQSGDVEASEVSLAMALGDHVRLDQLLIKAQDAGASASQIVSTALRHLHALLAAKAHGAGSEDVNAARQRGLWGQSDAIIGAQLRTWRQDRLAAAVRVLGDAEAETRMTAVPDWPIAARALLHAARLAR